VWIHDGTQQGAVLMLTKAIALDHAHLGVLCPGFFDTRTMYRITKCWAAKANSNESLTSFQPTIGRPIETREIAEPMAFLPSDASGAMTGSAMISTVVSSPRPDAASRSRLGANTTL
jgi:meso-butanediol dehydrogenase / (S,S)-butanediol dehydrogenase / diacetyl reductase